MGRHPPLALEMLGTIVLVHGANGWLFTNKGGGWKYPAFWTMGLITLFLLGVAPWRSNRSSAVMRDLCGSGPVSCPFNNWH